MPPLRPERGSSCNAQSSADPHEQVADEELRNWATTFSSRIRRECIATHSSVQELLSAWALPYFREPDNLRTFVSSP